MRVALQKLVRLFLLLVFLSYNKEKIYTMVDGFVLSPSMLSLVEGGLASILDRNNFYQGSDHCLIYLDLMDSK